jgi:ABC-type molybdate transport system permease subunit
MTESLYVPCLFYRRVGEKGLVLIAVDQEEQRTRVVSTNITNRDKNRPSQSLLLLLLLPLPIAFALALGGC